MGLALRSDSTSPTSREPLGQMDTVHSEQNVTIKEATKHNFSCVFFLGLVFKYTGIKEKSTPHGGHSRSLQRGQLGAIQGGIDILTVCMSLKGRVGSTRNGLDCLNVCMFLEKSPGQYSEWH